jgi:hypothetical protein
MTNTDCVRSDTSITAWKMFWGCIEIYVYTDRSSWWSVVATRLQAVRSVLCLQRTPHLWCCLKLVSSEYQGAMYDRNKCHLQSGSRQHCWRRRPLDTLTLLFCWTAPSLKYAQYAQSFGSLVLLPLPMFCVVPLAWSLTNLRTIKFVNKIIVLNLRKSNCYYFIRKVCGVLKFENV